MNYLSVCSGIEAATVGWHSLGWKPVAFSEIEPFPCAALAHHYPNVPNWGDMTKFKEWPDANIDVLVGGTPCQSFSVAGLRKGLDDPRGNLMLTYLAIAAKYRPEWLVWENVPGVLSSNEGRDFASLLRGMAELGYGFAYRILDAQYFGVPQRRRRVFVVGHLGSWQRAAAVLFERHSLQWHPAPLREAGKRVAKTVTASLGTGGADYDTKELIGGIDYENNGHGPNDPTGPLLKGSPTGGGRPLPAIVMSTGQAGAEIGIGIGTTLNCNHEAPIVTHSLRGEGFDASEDGTGRGTPLVPVAYSMITANTGANGLGVAAEVAPTLDRAQPCAIAFAQNQRDEPGMKQQTFVATTFRAKASFNLGVGVGVAGTLEAVNPTAVAFVPQADGAQTTLGYDEERGTAPTLSKCQTPAVVQSLYNKGINQGENDASPQETNTGKILLRVRQEIGAKAFAQWGLGILDSLRTAKILRPEVHGEKFRQAPFSRSWVVCCALGSPFTRSEGAMQSLREALGEGCPSQGWESLEQCDEELGAYLSQLSQPGTQAERFMHDLWQADEGAGLLREALSEIQAVGRSDAGEGKPAHQVMQVRRLTPLCCEFLQGFPRNYTLIPVRGKPAADGPRYKALGNSMAVPVMAWIGKRIQQVEEISCTTKQKYLLA